MTERKPEQPVPSQLREAVAQAAENPPPAAVKPGLGSVVIRDFDCGGDVDQNHFIERILPGCERC